MSALLDIQKQLSTADQRVTRLEQALRDNPAYPSIAANLDSAVRLQAKLRDQFVEASAAVGLEVCKYRAFSEDDKVSAGAAFGAISVFQRLVSVVWGATKYGKKQIARVDTALEHETAMGLGYSFAGSVGVVLTIRPDEDLFGDSSLSQTMNTVFAMAKASEPSDIQKYADELGRGAVNALYDWARANTDYGLGADIEWALGREAKGAVFVQRQELLRLESVIEAVSTMDREQVTYDGELRAADLDAHKFKLRRQGFKAIAGTFEVGAIDDNHKASLPKWYRADVVVTTTTQLATGRKTKKYHLLRLHDIKDRASDGQ